MPIIITLPGSRNGPDNIVATVNLPDGLTVLAAGATAYGSLRTLFTTGHSGQVSFTNNGIIWNISTENVGTAINGMNSGTLTNNGLIVSEAPQGNAYGIFNGSRMLTESLVNTGSVFAIAAGNAGGVEMWDPDVHFDNSGLVAAYAPSGTIAGVGAATGVAMFNGGVLDNRAGARILAEGLWATALIFSRGNLVDPGRPQIVNAGLIEAKSLNPANESIAILTGALSVEILRIENSGVIRADIAYRSDSKYFSPPNGAPDQITNLEGGQIYGRIETDLGPDRVINKGLIHGRVLLGEGADFYDGRGGSQIGGVFGDGGDDVLIGGAGSEQLYGGTGDDKIDGGSGSDILDGGAGNDRIVYDAADTPSQVTGGAGNDVLVVDGSAPTNFDLIGQGFEAAEVTQRVQDGNIASTVHIYNGNWQVVEVTTNYANGTRVTVNADPTNAYDTRQVWYSYDALGRLSNVDNIYDNGTRVYVNRDEDGTKAWREDWFVYDSQGRLDSEDVLYDGGSRTFINFDQDNSRSWAQDWFNYDALGRLDSEDIVYDDGSHTFINLDQDNSQTWSSAWFSYDPQGRLDTQDVINDDGSRVFTNYDQAGAEAFQRTVMFYSASGALTHQLVVWDDGSTKYDYF